MKHLKKRWDAPTPEFWKKVQSIGVVVGGLGLVFIAPPFGMATVGSYFITAGSIVGLLSQLTVVDSKKLEEKN